MCPRAGIEVAVPEELGRAKTSEAPGVRLRSAPVLCKNTETKMLLLQRQKAIVELSVHMEDGVWLMVSRPGGMKGWLAMDDVQLECAQDRMCLEKASRPLLRSPSKASACA